MAKKYDPLANRSQSAKWAESLDEVLDFFVGDSTEESSRQTAGSADYTYTREQEVNRQRAEKSGEEPPPGYYTPMINGADFNSTRVQGFRYVPHDPNDSTDSGLGTIYVRFIKRGDEYYYSNIPYGVYAAFATDGVSKGKFINSTLNHFGYKRDDDGLFFTF